MKSVNFWNGLHGVISQKLIPMILAVGFVVFMADHIALNGGMIRE
jgi:hypothetical protein